MLKRLFAIGQRRRGNSIVNAEREEPTVGRVPRRSSNDTKDVTRPAQQRNALWARATQAADRKAFSWRVRSNLYTRIAALVGNGIQIEKALELQAHSLSRNKRRDSARIVRNAARRMRDGVSLSDALDGWVPVDELGVIAAGEAAGVLSDSLRSLVAMRKRVRRVTIAYRNAFVRPAIYMASIYGVVWAVGKYAVPQMALYMPTSRATGVVAGLFAAGRFAMSWQALLPPLLAIGIAIAIRWSFPRWTGRWRVLAEGWFPYSYYRDAQGFMWLSGFVALIKSHEADVAIIKRQLRYASPWLKERLTHFHRGMADGDPLPDVLSAPVSTSMPVFAFPNPDIIDDIAAFWGFPDFAEKINEVLREWAERLEESTLANAAVFAFGLELVMYALMGLLMYAINAIGTQARF